MACQVDIEIEEKENFYRLCQLLVDGATKVLREAFDDRIDPAALPQLLRNRKKTLVDLKRDKFLTKAQLDTIYPGKNQYGTSQDFDISIIINLLRNICKEDAPVKGWDAMPDPADVSFSADLVRLRYYRNDLYAHRSSCRVDNEEFNRCWEDISVPLIRIGGNIWKERIKEYQTGPVSQDEFRLLEELSTWHELDMQLRKQMSQVQNEMLKHSQEVTNVFDAISETERMVTRVSATVDHLKVRMSGRSVLWNSLTTYSKSFILLALIGGTLLIITRFSIHSEHADDFICFKVGKNRESSNEYLSTVCYDRIVTNFLPLFLTQLLFNTLLTFSWSLINYKKLTEIFTLATEPNVDVIHSTYTAPPDGVSLKSLHCTYMVSVLIKLWCVVTFICSQIYLHGIMVKPWNKCILEDTELTCHIKDAEPRNYILYSNLLLNAALLIIVAVELVNLYNFSTRKQRYCTYVLINNYKFCVEWLNGKRLDRHVRAELVKFGYESEDGPDKTPDFTVRHSKDNVGQGVHNNGRWVLRYN